MADTPEHQADAPRPSLLDGLLWVAVSVLGGAVGWGLAGLLGIVTGGWSLVLLGASPVLAIVGVTQSFVIGRYAKPPLTPKEMSRSWTGNSIGGAIFGVGAFLFTVYTFLSLLEWAEAVLIQISYLAAVAVYAVIQSQSLEKAYGSNNGWTLAQVAGWGVGGILGVLIADRVGSFPATNTVTGTHVFYLIVLGAVSSLVAGAVTAWALSRLRLRPERVEPQAGAALTDEPSRGPVEAAPEERA